ncbi:MAG: GNAT family N-acetyltransferase [Blastocatellia bacterium]
MIAIIPARYASTRLPGKMLLLIAGKPLILHTLERAAAARNVSRVIVATDDERILRAVLNSGGEAVMTRGDHNSGSDRVAEVAEKLPEGSIIVNVQGDEPLISPRTIEKAVEAVAECGLRSAELSEPRAVAAGLTQLRDNAEFFGNLQPPANTDSIDKAINIATAFEPITNIADVLSPDVVKVVTDDDGMALYFSRSPIPFLRDEVNRYGNLKAALTNDPALLRQFKKHTGLYVYRREYLLEFTKLPQSRLEKIEMLEQLRALENGAYIKVIEAASSSIGIDTKEDFERVQQILTTQAVTIRKATETDISDTAHVYVESVRKAFAGIEPEWYLNSLSPEKREQVMLERFSRENYRLFVAENDKNGIVGFIDCGKPVLDKVSHERQIFSFYVLPEFQRMGIGKRLFLECSSQVIDEGCNSLCLDTLEASPFRTFYEKMGGSVLGRGAHKIGEENFATIIYGWDNLEK